MEAAAERQRAAVTAAMGPSLSAQKAAIRKQAATANLALPERDAEESFLILPWPAPDPTLSSRLDCEPLPNDRLSPLIDQTAEREGVSPALIRAVVARESGFRPCAVSPKGAAGLMQLMPETQRTFRVTDPFDPRQSLAAGSRLLKQLLDRFDGDLPRALGAYNAGIAPVDRAGGIPPIPETQDYVTGIMGKLATEN